MSSFAQIRCFLSFTSSCRRAGQPDEEQPRGQRDSGDAFKGNGLGGRRGRWHRRHHLPAVTNSLPLLGAAAGTAIRKQKLVPFLLVPTKIFQ